jgi:hypothetical protein
MEQKIYELPFIYDKNTENNSFHIFENTIFPNIGNTPRGCYDTINSKCEFNKTFDKCLDMCDKNDNCGYGIYLQNEINGDSVCLPMRTQAFPDANPVPYFLPSHEFSNETKVNSTAFLKKSKFTYPEQYTSRIAFDCPVYLVNSDTNKTLFTKNVGNDIVFLDGKNTPELEILPTFDTQHYPKYLYSFIRYGNEFFINSKETTLILNKNKDSNNFEWNIILNPSFEGQIPFKIVDLKNNKYTEHLRMFDTFNILYQDKYVLALDENDNLVSVDKDNIPNNYKINFTFIYAKTLNYCDGYNCVSLNKDENWNLKVSNDGKDNLMYKNNVVYYLNTCSLYCDYNRNFFVRFYRTYPKITVFIFVILAILIYYLKIRNL